tara:strand:+ start:108 stop:362 length:255 start_codon:yes stop_codon:yes gene_type:complete
MTLSTIYTARDLQTLMQLLRNVAEVDPDDIISNCASQIAYEFESTKVPLDLSDLNDKRQQVIRYAISKRQRYILKPGARHAVIV